MATTTSQRRDMTILLVLQVILAIIFGFYTGYDSQADARTPISKLDPQSLEHYYPMFQDVHVMIFAGFGFLMTFLKKYGYSSVGFTLLLGALMIQWGILCHGFYNFDPQDGKIRISLTSLLSADVSTAAILISMGAVLGKTTPLQLLLMGLIEMVICVGNEYLGLNILKAVDAGGSMYIHIFGAYFGLAVSLVLRHSNHVDSSEGDEEAVNNEGASYTSDLFAMIGTVFLWMFWPSFNGALAEGDDQHRAVINTYLALASCCVTAFAVSSLVSKENKFDMVHIQNSTLAGGVAIGTAADMMVQPFGAIVVGMIAGAVSVLGYRYLQPYLLSHMKLHDTCGVHNLHGMPGVIAGIVGAILAAIATENDYNYSLYQQFPAMAPRQNSSEFSEYLVHLMKLEPGDNRSAGVQAGYQLLAMLITFVIAVVSGAITGFLIKLPWVGKVHQNELFDDGRSWEVASEHHHIHQSLSIDKTNNDGTLKIIETLCHDPYIQP